MQEGSYVYILANRAQGALYVGVTSNLRLRVHQHRKGVFGSFTRRYKIYLLVYYEKFENIADAIAYEKRLKRWRRAWKIDLIEGFNPEWDDLSKW